ncbi:hypothetical protein [Corynebacterium glyciniphilum]|uniref:hypothetical protein n=1 Tax=Corynebacterium glyciniphilum TaxID=1404244 RepID=UPI001642BB0D|nr:hypothetical protein [Corynebacterium glyciniphilum]
MSYSTHVIRAMAENIHHGRLTIESLASLCMAAPATPELFTETMREIGRSTKAVAA